MTDPLRTDHLPEAGEVPERERDARVEDLLLAGLDHYFVGQHELAISVWTRVLFLDRGHARARAYIDRARSAIAERQREGDELLHTSAAAFDRGDAGAARTLLTSAVERGAHSEEALVLLERINRFEPTRVRPARSAPTPRPDVQAEPLADRSAASRAAWIATGVLAGLATAGVVAWVALTRPDWIPLTPVAVAPRTVVAEEPLPVPSPAEAWVARARGLYEDGRLRDALGVLDAVSESDPMRRESDELRAVIQRTLLEAARLPPVPQPGAAVVAPRPSRPPQPPPAPPTAPTAKGGAQAVASDDAAPRDAQCEDARATPGEGAGCAPSAGQAMKCPKCHYISFGSSDRCRNCGYEFVLAAEASPVDLPIQSGDQAIGPLADFVLTDRGFTPQASSLPDARTTGAAGVRRAAAASAASRFDLPLFSGGGSGEGGDAPLVTPSAIPRTPLSVRRGQPTMPRPSDRASDDGDANRAPILRVRDARPSETAFPRAAPHGAPAPVALESASVLARVFAGLVDVLVLGLIDAAVVYSTLRIVGLPMAGIFSLPAVPLGVFLLLLNGGYLAIFTTAGGQTIGKMLARIKVVADPSPTDPESLPGQQGVSLGAAVLRASAYLVSLLPAGLGFAAILFDSDGRALHDRLAETRVVKA